MRSVIAILAILTASLSFVAQQTHAQSASAIPIDEVLVTGEQPGPGLWRVTNGEHVVWILGISHPLPKQMTWRSQQVQEIMRNADAVIPAGWEVKPIFSVSLLVKFLRERKLPDKATLQETLPVDLYERFVTLRDKYAPGDRDLERLRPLEAVRTLNSRAISSANLGYDNVVQEDVRRLARHFEVDYDPVKIKVKADEMRVLLDENDEIPRDREIACFKVTLDWLESSLDELKLQAAAWAKGNLEALRAIFKARRERGDALATKSCMEGLRDRAQWREVNERGNAAWFAAVKAALEKNRSTLVLADIGTLLDPKGLLAKFRSQGYSVEEP